MTTKRINIDELKLGMFIAELDVSWIKSPYFRHKRLISTLDDIKLLKKAGVKKVLIDLDKGENIKEQNLEVSIPDENKPTAMVSTVTTNLKIKNASTLDEELNAAINIKKSVVEAVNLLIKQVENGEAVDITIVPPIIDKTIDSLNRNNQALLTLFHQSRKDSKLTAHVFGVFTLSMLLAKEHGLSQEQTETLALAAMLHDGGWSKLPNSLLGKGKKYTEAESKLVKQHLTILERAMEGSDAIPEVVKTVIQQHHELGDGSGYPKGLKLHEIHPLARMLTICDLYDEMVHGLGEKPGMVAANAISNIFRLGQKKVLDNSFTVYLAKFMGVLPLSSGVLLDTGEKAVIIENNHTNPLLPVIKICYDPYGNPKPKPVIVRLANQRAESTIKIESVIDPNDPKVDPAGVLSIGEDESR